MSWSFLLVVVALVLAPGADFALIVRNTISGGRFQGVMTTAGVSSAAAIQGMLATAGLTAVIVRVQPLFICLKWAGAAYLAWLAISMLRSALRGDYGAPGSGPQTTGWTGYRQGFLCNATNPKILVFYLSLLSQFVSPDASWATWLAHAWMVPFIGTIWCLTVVAFVGALRLRLQRRSVRRALDAFGGFVLAGFCVELVRET